MCYASCICICLNKACDLDAFRREVLKLWQAELLCGQAVMQAKLLRSLETESLFISYKHFKRV